MKHVSIQIPPNGAAVHLLLRPGATSGQAVIVASDEVEVCIARPSAASPTSPSRQNSKAPAPNAKGHDLDAILKRLIKSKPNKRATAINFIKAMFQFDEQFTDQDANKIFDDLRKRGSLNIDANDKIQF